MKLPFNAAPVPLLADPTGCAHIWLRKYLDSQSIPHETCNQNNERFTYTLELAIRFGKCLIIQDVQLTKPPLLSILYGELKCRFNKKYLQVASKLVDFHEDFKLVLVSRLSKIDVGMEVGAFVATIPFTTTVSGYTGEQDNSDKNIKYNLCPVFSRFNLVNKTFSIQSAMVSYLLE